ncbi:MULTISPECIES: hypothetical protein [unclassified Calothrix]|uniref:hypothetical protein n=1 Tax=unclassified Calothrix TaxID=2619626 RepID=UPI0018EF791A|nr:MULTISPECIES: hypothetical protein [unclassified Calothrix]
MFYTNKVNQAILGSKYWIMGLVSTAMVFTPAIALANHEYWLNSVRDQLIRAAVGLNLGGNYELTHDPFVDQLSSNQGDYITLNLRRGVDYAILGVCDQDCRDIDLRLYDEDGNLIDSDTGYDDYPAVRVRPRWSGKFQIKVTMAKCRANYCYYGIGAFGR